MSSFGIILKHIGDEHPPCLGHLAIVNGELGVRLKIIELFGRTTFLLVCLYFKNRFAWLAWN